MALGTGTFSLQDIQGEVYGTTSGTADLVDLVSKSGGYNVTNDMAGFDNFNGTPGTCNTPSLTDSYPSGIDMSWAGSSLPDNFNVYRVDRSVNGGGYSFLVDTASTSYTDPNSNLTQGNDYAYRVRQVTDGNRQGTNLALGTITGYGL